MSETPKPGMGRRAFLTLIGLAIAVLAAVRRLFHGARAADRGTAASDAGGEQLWGRFTEKARRAVWRAREEAVRLGAKEVTPEHLLIGTIDSESVAARLLERLGVSVRRLQEEIAKQPGLAPGVAGQDLQLGESGRRVIEYASEEPSRTNDTYVGTEHLLAGIVREETSLAARVLLKHGVTLDRVRAETDAMIEGQTD